MKEFHLNKYKQEQNESKDFNTFNELDNLIQNKSNLNLETTGEVSYR